MVWRKRAIIFGCIGLCICWVYHERNNDVILAASAKKYAGDVKWVCGKACQVRRIREGKVLIDFGNAYPKQSFTAVFTPGAYADVCREQGQIKVGDWISVRGIIDLYAGCPEIRVYEDWNVLVNPQSPDYSPADQ
jgi:hypothetical protein